MKFNKVTTLAKRSKMAIIVDDEDVQWLSIGSAAYKLERMPVLDEATLLAVMGVEEDKKASWNVSRDNISNMRVLREAFDGEVEITADDVAVSIIHNAKLLTPILTFDGVVWIDTELMAPLGSGGGYRHMFLRKAEKHRFIAIRDGLILRAVIGEYDPEVDTLTDALENLADRCSAERRRRIGEKSEGEV